MGQGSFRPVTRRAMAAAAARFRELPNDQAGFSFADAHGAAYAIRHSIA
jgi:hypothetical protein